jgi:hypothetical protein
MIFKQNLRNIIIQDKREYKTQMKEILQQKKYAQELGE